MPFCCWYPGREGLRALGSPMRRGRIRCPRGIRWCIVSPRVMRTSERPGFRPARGTDVPGAATADPYRAKLPRRAAAVHARRRDLTRMILFGGVAFSSGRPVAADEITAAEIVSFLGLPALLWCERTRDLHAAAGRPVQGAAEPALPPEGPGLGSPCVPSCAISALAAGRTPTHRPWLRRCR